MDCLFVGQHIIELSSVDSTNNYLIDLSQNKSLLEGTVVIAKEQTAGKGQRNNRWSSEAGKSLCMSILLKPKLDVSQQFLFNKFIALSLCQALNNYSLTAKIKWPNDILIDSKKVAGILVENSIRGSKIEKSVVGVGVNINNNISQLPSATSLADCLNTIPTVSELLELICKKIEKNYFLLKQKPSMINELYHQNLFQFPYQVDLLHIMFLLKFLILYNLNYFEWLCAYFHGEEEKHQYYLLLQTLNLF